MASQGEAKGATGTRCTRPDCTSIREELELLRGDLLELEGENEQLHDQLTAFQSEASAREVSTQQKLLEKDQEVKSLSDVVAALTAQLQEQIGQSQEQGQKSETKSSPAKATADALEQELTSLKAKNEELETKLKELQAQVEREASAGLAAQRQVARVEGETKDKRSELFTALKENEVLRAEAAEQQEAMKQTVEQVTEYEVLVRGLQDQLEVYRDAVDEQTVEITQLHTKLAQLEQEKLAVEAKLIEMDEHESDVDALMSDARAKFDMEKAVLTTELDELRRKLKQQQFIHEQQQQQVQQTREVEKGDEEVDTKPSAAMEDLEKQLEMLQELRVRDKSTILELNQRVLQQQSDLESLAAHLDVDAMVESAVNSALHKQKSQLEALEQENKTLKRRLKEQRALVQDLELRQGLVEKQLAEAEEWNAKYEQKAGLEDVMKYQKRLRAQLEQQQQLNVKLRQDVNDQVEAAGKLYIAFKRLKAETGKPDTFEYDDLAITDHLKGQLAINEAVMKQMEIQIHELEAERLRFLQKLRDQARLTGGKLYEQHGLTTEQWGIVEEFIDRVKHTPEVAKRFLQADYEVVPGRDEDQSPQTARSQKNIVEELERKLEISFEENTLLLKELENLQNELEAARTETSAVVPADSSAVTATYAPAYAPSETPAASQQSGGPDGNRTEILRALESAKAKSQRQEGVIYHLRAEITTLRRECEQNKKKEGVSLHVSPAHPAPIAEATQGKSQPTIQTFNAETQTPSCTERKQSENAIQLHSDNDDDDDVASLSSLDDDGFTLVVKNERSASKQGEQSSVEHSPTELSCSKVKKDSKSTEGWSDQADNIALVVAKAIEAQFAMLQAQKGLLLAPESPHSHGLSGPTVKAPAMETVSSQTKQQGMVEAAASTSPAPPRSPFSHEMVNTLAFETEDEMVQHVDFLRELNVCMDELVATEARNEELQKQLLQHEEVFQSLMDQHTVLYQHFFRMHAQYTNAEIRLRDEIERLTQDNKDYNLKCQRYEAGLHLLGVQSQHATVITSDSLVSGNEAQLRSDVIELTRKIAVYEVNEARLKRKYQQLHNEWRSSTEHNKLLQREWSEMEKTLKYRVLYLETWKQGADEMMERMEKTLEKSVLREFADKQQRVVADVLKKYNALSEVYAEMHVKYLQMCELPMQLGRVQHELMVLRAEKSARNDSNCSTDPILQERINQLENDLEMQTERVKELEEAGREALVPDELVQSSVNCPGGDDELRSENTLLYERINEVEQLYEGLALECAKYKDIATLAASQANVLSKRAAQEKGNREQQEEQLRELMAASEDHAIVGELHHQLMQIKATYQQFLIQYDLVTETQQQTLLKNQGLELEMEKKAQKFSADREKSNDKLQTFENAMVQVKERDWMARNSKWEAFRKRLDALEDDMLIEQQRRKQLEKDLEDKQAHLPLLDLRQQRGNQSEVGRLKSRIDALETRERLLLGQLEAATKPSGSKEKEERLQVELRESRTLNEDLMQQLEAIQSRIAELLRLNGELEAEKRELRCKYEDLQLDLQYARSGLPADGGRREHDNQREFKHDSSHSPLMKQKVGLYEKDQAELQQAAQATIASLKQLVEEKNTLINEYQRKLISVRATSAQGKAQDRLETTQLNKKLYEENQRMIGQLKEAMSTISSMERSGKSKQALQAAQERHDHVLQEWKQAELALEGAKQSVRELQMEREVLRNERDLAEARAGEALEEIVLLKDKVAECERHSQKLEHQVAFVKRDLVKKEEKLKLLRDAIIKLKEEFLKAEDRHAIEIAKAQHTMNQDFSTRKRKEKERREEEEEEWREEKTRLQSQVQMLQEKLVLQKKKQGQQQRRKKTADIEEKEEKESTSEVDTQVLKDEVERLKRLLKEKVISESRAVEALEKKIKILQAQNVALREASVSAPAISAPTDSSEVGARREKMDLNRKLQRRVDTLTLRLKEKEEDAANKVSELACCNERISRLQDELQSHKATSEKERLAPPAPAGTAVSSAMHQLEELERQNAFLQETLALKRKEWEDAFSTQMERYEVQLQRLRRRLVQHSVPVDGEDSAADAEPSLRLRREEHQFLVGQEVQAELLVLGDEFRTKEQEMVAKDTRLLELELEVESLRLEYKRHQRTSQRGADLSGSNEHETPRQRRMKGGFGGGRGSSWATQERQELEEVIENMKKVIEKLRAENGKLKKAAAKQAQVTPDRVDALRRKLKDSKDTRERLEAQVEKLQHNCGELKKDKLKLQQKLRAKSTTPTSSPGISALDLQLKEKDNQLLHAEQEMAELRHQVIQLEVQIERNAHNEGDEDMIQEQDERIKELQTQVLELEDENTKLTNELAAFDEDFFEEIEDLKYKYAQAVRDKRQLEKRLAGGPGGLSPASTSSHRHRRG
ncbi:hypothetical protein PHYBOEH_000270 [Phytophthora boehmeriae]|uniref:Centrosome-associated protein n=1 Tax=Phytophthora boehmeriae TaxID=109152 RepID=A0A8T1WX23_9STRA|nr:hypothetical protein PHYBOEH_000270 [Phytophthora boehmeriae]